MSKQKHLYHVLVVSNNAKPKLDHDGNPVLRRDGTPIIHDNVKKESAIIQGDKLEAVRMEMADIQIYLIRIADKLNVDLLDAVEKKIDINEQKYPEDKVKGQHKKYTEYEE